MTKRDIDDVRWRAVDSWKRSHPDAPRPAGESKYVTLGKLTFTLTKEEKQELRASLRRTRRALKMPETEDARQTVVQKLEKPEPKVDPLEQVSEELKRKLLEESGYYRF
jgi:hypothetical protein